jgi:ferric-dicitrate binding protein FerR (iron transport regulator)
MENKNGHIDYFDLIVKVLANEASEEEKRDLEYRRKSDPELEDMYTEYLMIWNQLGKIKDIPDIDLDNEWIALQKKMQDVDTGFSRRQVKASFGMRVLRYAAMIAFVVLAGYGIVMAVNTFSPEKVIAKETIRQVELPDGSKVTLNSNAVIRYNQKIAGNDQRKVKLEGDAHFDVKSDKTKPFVIDVDEVIVEVKGTSFYVDARKCNDRIDVIVESGIVEVYLSADKSKSVVLSVGERCSYDKAGGQLVKTENETVNYLSWKTGVISFKERELKLVARELSEIYDRRVVVTCDELKDMPFAGEYEYSDTNLHDILLYIQESIDGLQIKELDSRIELTKDGCE